MISHRDLMGERASDLATYPSTCIDLYFGAKPPAPLFSCDPCAFDAAGDTVADRLVDAAPILERTG